MISHAKKFIFIHIPKTGGVSITKSLHNFFDEPKCNGHEPQTEYAKVVNLDDYYQFTIVRNPWDRICSAFFYIKQGDINTNNPTPTSKIDFLTFIKDKKYFDVELTHYKPHCTFLDYNLKKS